jgi:hypothetical protein
VSERRLLLVAVILLAAQLVVEIVPPPFAAYSFDDTGYLGWWPVGADGLTWWPGGLTFPWSPFAR